MRMERGPKSERAFFALAGTRAEPGGVTIE